MDEIISFPEVVSAMSQIDNNEPVKVSPSQQYDYEDENPRIEFEGK